MKQYLLTAEQGTYTLTGFSAEFAVGFTMQADTGTYALSGQSANLLRGSLINAEAGTYALTGLDANLLRSLILAAEAGSYTLTGNAVQFIFGVTMQADVGNYILTGHDSGLIKASVLLGETGTYTLTGFPASLTSTATGQINTAYLNSRKLAQRQIQKRGRTVTYKDRSSTLQDPLKPWLGTTGETDLFPKALFIDQTFTKRSESLVQQGDFICLIAADDMPNVVPATQDKIVDKGRELAIIDIEPLDPGDAAIFYQFILRA